MSILVLFLQTKNSNDCINYLTYIKQLNLDYLIYMRDGNNISGFPTENVHYYKDTFFNFNNIKDIVKKYDYLLYLDDNWEVNDTIQSHLLQSTQILNNNIDIDQVIFQQLDKNFTEKNINDMLLQFPIIEDKTLDDFNLFHRMTTYSTIFSTTIFENPYPKSDLIQIEHVNTPSKKLPFYNFRILPGLTRISKLLWEQHFVKNDYMEYVYAELLEKQSFTTCYLNHQSQLITNNNIIVDNTDGSNITIVTAFINLNLARKHKRESQQYDYIDKAKDTLSIRQNMVVYLTNDLIEYVKKFRSSIGLSDKTRIIEVSPETHLYLYNKIDIVRNNVKKNRPPYNVAEYILAVNSRYDLIKDAIKNNYLDTDYFAWVDFAAGHIVNIPQNFQIKYSKIDKIRLSRIGRVKSQNYFVYDHQCCGGGVYIGHKTIMLEFIKIHDIEFQKIMNMGYCINDDKLLFLIFEKYPHLFDIYVCGYKSLLTNA